MPRTFDIRFARATGFAGILEAPANTFRWRGAASLIIDERGLEIEPKRGLHSLFARRPRFRINTADLREVSRAADALRIEFGLPGARRAVVPVWARDSEAAAEIVRLVPTRRTIETDDPIAVEVSDPRRNRMLLAAFALVMVGVAAWYAMPHDSPAVATLTPETSEPLASIAPAGNGAPSPNPLPQAEAAQPSRNPVVDAAPAPVPERPAETVEPPSDAGPAADAQPEAAPQRAIAPPPADSRTAVFVATDPLYDAAKRQLDKFQALAAHTYVGYLDGSVPLTELAASWGEYSQAVVTGPDYHEPRLRPMIDEELAAAASWIRALIAVGEARSSRDAARISAARADLERVSDLTTQIALHVERH